MSRGRSIARLSVFTRRVATPAAIACGVLGPSSAWAAALSGPVTGWSSGVPTYISMYEYVPNNVAALPPIVVAAHYCGGSASAFFGSASGIVAAADKYGFLMVFPQTTNAATSAKCWDVGSKASLTHDGGGDTQAIAEMVKYEVTKRNADASRVYIMGASSGAMLTEAMLAVYPDVFKAGSEFSGVPAGCWSDGWSAASNWGGTCASGKDIMTAQQWGDLVRGMYPGYTGYRPRIQLWHGTGDTTVYPQNQTEAIKEWTNVLGLNATPSSTDSTSVAGFTIEKWQNSCGFTVLEAHTQAGGGHTTPIDANSVISFFGLDKTGPDPEIAACGDGGAGGSTSTSTSGSGGSTSGSGSTGRTTGSSTSTSGSGSTGRTTGSSTSTTVGGTSGNATSTGTSSGGTSSNGSGTNGSSDSTSSGTNASGASSGGGPGGSSSSGSGVSSDATSGGGGTPSTGGTVDDTGGSSGGGTNGTTGGVNSNSASSDGGAASANGSTSVGGCSCRVGNAGGSNAAAGGLFLVSAAMLMRRRKRTRG